MKDKRDIYCEYAFWEAFYQMEDEILHVREQRRLWDSFNDFLSTNRLFFDISIQNVDEETPGGEYIKELMRRNGGSGIKFIPRYYPRLGEFADNENYKLNAVYLTMKSSSECEELSKRFGIIVFNIPMIFEAKHVYRENGISFVRRAPQNWDYLLNLRESAPSLNCCNALVVVDRYLLYDINEKNTFEYNLKPVFKALLPNSLDNGIIFTICVIAENNIEKVASIEYKYDLLKALIKELRPDLNFRLTIYDSKIHDRAIITNNIILTSGAGFDVIGVEGRPLKDTSTSLCFPFLHSDKNELYLEWINSILKAKKNKGTNQQYYWGDSENKHHLLDYYSQKPAGRSPLYTPPKEPVLFHAG